MQAGHVGCNSVCRLLTKSSKVLHSHDLRLAQILAVCVAKAFPSACSPESYLIRLKQYFLLEEYRARTARDVNGTIHPRPSKIEKISHTVT